MEDHAFEQLEEGDRVLFNDRKVPLKVVAVEENRVHVEGPHGGEYVIFAAEETDDLLVRNKKSGRRYATYCRDLREVGKWEREGDRWKHSKTGAEIELVEDSSGFWTVKSSDFDLEEEIDLPMYGYSDKEFAEEDAEDLMEKHPEGR